MSIEQKGPDIPTAGGWLIPSRKVLGSNPDVCSLVGVPEQDALDPYLLIGDMYLKNANAL